MGTETCITCDGSRVIEIMESCDNCWGTGQEDVDCPCCDGAGTTDEGDGEIDCPLCQGGGTEQKDCEDCDGSGEVTVQEDCDDCGGTGEISVTEITI